MNKIIKLAKMLYRLGLHKEASNTLRLSPVEHPDWESSAKEFGQYPISEDEYLNQVIIPPRDKDIVAIDSVLKENGIRPVSTEEFDGLIGAGAFGKVIRAIYNGKPVVAKIIISDGQASKESNDFNVWDEISKLRDLMPPEVKKHFPEIYLLKNGKIVINNRKKEYQIIVSEELFPITKSDIEILSGYKQSPTKLMQDLLLFCDTLSLKLSTALPPNGERVLKIKSKELALSFFNIITGEEGSSWHSPLEVINEGILLQNPDRRGNFELILSDDEKDIISNLISENESLFKVNKKYPFPIHNYEKYHSYSPSLGKAEDLYNAVMWLSKNGIRWGDLNFDNILRDSSGTLKIMDVGAFQIYK